MNDATREPARHPGLQIEEDYPLQWKEWLLERIGWTLIFLTMAAGALGLLAPGPLSRTVAGTEGRSLWAVFDKRVHLLSDIDLSVHDNAPGQSGDWSIEIERSYLERMRIEAIEPEPSRAELTAGGVRYFFATAADGEDRERNDSEPARSVTFSLRPQAGGMHSGEIRSGDRTVRVAQFVFP